MIERFIEEATTLEELKEIENTIQQMFEDEELDESDNYLFAMLEDKENLIICKGGENDGLW